MTALDRLRIRIPEADDTLLTEMLDSAEQIILSLRYPYSDFPDVFPKKYEGLKVDMAEDLYNRIGASGQLSHNENGINRTWGSEWVSKELCSRVVPLCGGLK